MLVTILTALALTAWVAVLALPSRPHRTHERVEAGGPTPDADLAAVTVLIPARNEAAVLERTLGALSRQGRDLAVIVVDDESTDGTAALCERFAEHARVDLIRGAPLPDGWGGKLWALEQGLARIETPRVLLLDADIELAPGTLPRLLDLAGATGAALVSVMAELRCRTFWERLLVPPFIFFFKLIYPFAWVNDSRRGTAAAAGGCVLVETAALREVGGFTAIRSALIDDCALAALVKRTGRPIWLGLSHSVISLRSYATLGSFAQMVTRTAFTQLRYSVVLLVLVTLAMLVAFGGPAAFVWPGATVVARTLAALGLAASCLAYLPTVRFYGLPTAWTLTLPLAALLFLGMTWLSALNYWRGIRAEWKDRAYASD